MSRKIVCNILTPEKLLYEGEVDHAVIQSFNGRMGFLYNHAPLISTLGVGSVRLDTTNSTEQLWVENGIVEVKNNKMIILAETAYKKDDIDKAKLEEELNEVKERLNNLEKYSEDRFTYQLERDKITGKINFISRN